MERRSAGLGEVKGEGFMVYGLWVYGLWVYGLKFMVEGLSGLVSIFKNAIKHHGNQDNPMNRNLSRYSGGSDDWKFRVGRSWKRLMCWQAGNNSETNRLPACLNMANASVTGGQNLW